MYIGFSGKLGTGKTEIAGRLSTLLGKSGASSAIMAFGDVLKLECARIYGFDPCLAWRDKGRIVPVPEGAPQKPGWRGKASVREILQYYGTDIRRTEDPDCWVKAFAKAAARRTDAAFILVDDVRFPNEKALIQSRGICFRVEPWPGHEISSFHESETMLDDARFDCHLWPEYGEEAVKRAACDALEFLLDRLTLHYQMIAAFRDRPAA